MKKVGFGLELKSRVSGIFRVVLYRSETSNGSGTEKVRFGQVREFSKFEKSGSGIEKTRVGEVPDPSLMLTHKRSYLVTIYDVNTTKVY